MMEMLCALLIIMVSLVLGDIGGFKLGLEGSYESGVTRGFTFQPGDFTRVLLSSGSGCSGCYVGPLMWAITSRNINGNSFNVTYLLDPQGKIGGGKWDSTISQFVLATSYQPYVDLDFVLNSGSPWQQGDTQLNTDATQRFMMRSTDGVSVTFKQYSSMIVVVPNMAWSAQNFIFFAANFTDPTGNARPVVSEIPDATMVVPDPVKIGTFTFDQQGDWIRESASVEFLNHSNTVKPSLDMVLYGGLVYLVGNGGGIGGPLPEVSSGSGRILGFSTVISDLFGYLLIAGSSEY